MRKNKNYLPVFEKNSYIHTATFHLIKTGRIPSVVTFLKIDVRRLYERIIKEYSLATNKIVRTDIHSNVLEKERLQSAYIELSDSITLSLMALRGEAEIFYDCTTPANELKKVESIIIEHVSKTTVERKVGLIVSDSGGSLDVREFTVDDFDNDITGLYNDGIMEFGEMLIAKLQQQNGKGIALLHGPPGCGKTHFISYVLGQVPQKRFLYLPSNMAASIASAPFLNFLTRQKNSVLIIEDAEEILSQRRSGSRAAVANLLNLADGFLAQCLRIQIIATFNANDLNKIDDALLRKGRIIGKRHFDLLSVDLCNLLLRKQNINYKTNQPMSLASIFNFSDTEYGNIRHEIGFEINGKKN